MRRIVIVPLLVAVSGGAQALDKKYLPSRTYHEPTAAERLNAFKPPPPPPRQPSTFDKVQGAVTHTFENGNTIRPDVGYSHGSPTIGVKGTFKHP